MVGKLPVRIKFEGIYYTLQPDSFAPQWWLQLTVTPVTLNRFQEHGTKPTFAVYRVSSCDRARMTDSIQCRTTSVARNRRSSIGRRSATLHQRRRYTEARVESRPRDRSFIRTS